MKELYLIRHGQTEANEHHQYCGSSDLLLSEAGKAALTGFRYHICENCRFFTSGMLRTEQTLELLFGTTPHTRDPRFREIDFGAFELHTYDQLKDREDYQTWISQDGLTAPPGGESAQEFRKRVLEGLQDLPEENAAVLVTHGGVIALIMEQLFPRENKNRYQWQPRPGSGYRIVDNNYELLTPTERSNQP